MTNQKDVLVVEAVGYTLWEYTERYQRQFVLRPGDDRTCSLYRQLEWNKYGSNIVASNRRIIPFITAPTGNTDQIVLEWVQGQDGNLQSAFVDRLVKVLVERQNETLGHWALDSRELDVMVRYYKPGMYAKALLAVIQEERGDNSC